MEHKVHRILGYKEIEEAHFHWQRMLASREQGHQERPVDGHVAHQVDQQQVAVNGVEVQAKQQRSNVHQTHLHHVHHGQARACQTFDTFIALAHSYLNDGKESITNRSEQSAYFSEKGQSYAPEEKAYNLNNHLPGSMSDWNAIGLRQTPILESKSQIVKGEK